MVSFSRSVWKKLHRAEKIYTGSARGARDNYEVCLRSANTKLELRVLSMVQTTACAKAPRLAQRAERSLVWDQPARFVRRLEYYRVIQKDCEL